MDLAPHVDQLRRELAMVAAVGGEEARALAERLAATLESATRLALLEALAAAADEITQDLAPGSVEVRLRGRDPGFVVTPPPQSVRSLPEQGESGQSETPHVPPPPETDDGGTSRISLRVPDHLKPRIEEAAAREGLSVNAWLVRAVSVALDPGSGRRSGRRPEPETGNRYRGWVR
ncbi:toxin-antitoxin system HicB family antitoxin [Microbispora sp. H11081]|uniref:toxin-antitoxin system HicB family antitoxin n=1 Tax=Microbispora sp. H11081 TaxID=2729107 RepID=UPI0014766992|nr:toxin-antitoxin system HicB family antitoxin [Microbispora sp. H11081]